MHRRSDAWRQRLRETLNGLALGGAVWVAVLAAPGCQQVGARTPEASLIGTWAMVTDDPHLAGTQWKLSRDGTLHMNGGAATPQTCNYRIEGGTLVRYGGGLPDERSPYTLSGDGSVLTIRLDGRFLTTLRRMHP